MNEDLDQTTIPKWVARLSLLHGRWLWGNVASSNSTRRNAALAIQLYRGQWLHTNYSSDSLSLHCSDRSFSEHAPTSSHTRVHVHTQLAHTHTFVLLTGILNHTVNLPSPSLPAMGNIREWDYTILSLSLTQSLPHHCLHLETEEGNTIHLIL